MPEKEHIADAPNVFTEIHPPLTELQALFESTRCLECGGPYAPAPCTVACPTHIDVPKFIREIREGRPLDSARTILEANILGGSCARVCPVEVLCEGACVLHREGRRPVSIGRLQRYATDWALKNSQNSFSVARKARNRIPSRQPPRASVGVIGAGPAGLACAAELAKLGYRITVYERKELPGGLITQAIAPYKQLLDPLPQEFELIRGLGVEFRFNVTVGRDLSSKDLEKRHSVIFLGVGLSKDVQAHLPGERLEGVWDSLEFIERLKRGRLNELQVGERVVVIGGGNTAIDCAREAVRLGAKDVVVLYRRTEKEMPAYAHEVRAAKKEGVRFLWLTAPIRFLGNERVEGVECIAMRLGAADVSGRPTPEPVPGSEFILEADAVIKAIGQQPHRELLEQLGLEHKAGLVQINEQYQTSKPYIFAGGDCVSGGGTVVEAVRDGRVAAWAIHRYLSAQAEKEAEPPRLEISVQEEGGIRQHFQGENYIAVNRALCKGCALCVNSCPTGILYLDGKSKIALRDIGKCIFCGLCEARCPDFAIWMVKSRPVLRQPAGDLI